MGEWRKLSGVWAAPRHTPINACGAWEGAALHFSFDDGGIFTACGTLRGEGTTRTQLDFDVRGTFEPDSSGRNASVTLEQISGEEVASSECCCTIVAHRFFVFFASSIREPPSPYLCALQCTVLLPCSFRPKKRFDTGARSTWRPERYGGSVRALVRPSRSPKSEVSVYSYTRSLKRYLQY